MTPSPAVDPEIKVCGAHACAAIARRRREDIRRIYLTEAQLPRFGELLRWSAEQRLAYHIVDDAELERITRSVHHGGIAMIVRQPPPPTLGALLHRLRGEAATQPRLLLYLDNVENPHNLGAILRVAAHFQADAVLVAGEGAQPSTAMLRTAEGGAEGVDLIPVALGSRPLLAVRDAGFTLIATTSHGAAGQRSLYEPTALPPRVAVMLGSESHGLAPAVRSLAAHEVTIPGSGEVESLNVACATAVILGEHWRRYAEGGAYSVPSVHSVHSVHSAGSVMENPQAPQEGERARQSVVPKRVPRGRPGGRLGNHPGDGNGNGNVQEGVGGASNPTRGDTESILAGKPGGKHHGKPGGKPGSKPGGKSGGKPGGKSSGKSSGKPSSKPSSKSGSKSGSKPGGKSGGKFGGKSGGKSGGTSGGKTSGKTGDKPGKPSGKPSKSGGKPGKPGKPGGKSGGKQSRRPGG